MRIVLHFHYMVFQHVWGSRDSRVMCYYNRVYVFNLCSEAFWWSGENLCRVDKSLDRMNMLYMRLRTWKYRNDKYRNRMRIGSQVMIVEWREKANCLVVCRKMSVFSPDLWSLFMERITYHCIRNIESLKMVRNSIRLFTLSLSSNSKKFHIGNLRMHLENSADIVDPATRDTIV